MTPNDFRDIEQELLKKARNAVDGQEAVNFMVAWRELINGSAYTPPWRQPFKVVTDSQTGQHYVETQDSPTESND
jgi:hypothetical protein